MKYFLGINIIRENNGCLKLSQKQCISNALHRFDMYNCKSIATPIEAGLKLEKELKDFTTKPYRELVGSLMYIMLSTRPDLSYSINYFSRYQNCASDNHYNYLKRILRYLKSTLDYELNYVRNITAPALVGYADADWGNDPDRRSITGYLFQVYGNTVSWVTRKQPVVSLSSTEAEYISLCNATTEAIWLKRLLFDLGIETSTITIYEDNQACISISKDPLYHKRIKHIDIKYHFIREQIQNKVIEPVYLATAEQTADILTKGLSREKFTYFRNKIGIK